MNCKESLDTSVKWISTRLPNSNDAPYSLVWVYDSKNKFVNLCEYTQVQEGQYWHPLPIPDCPRWTAVWRGECGENYESWWCLYDRILDTYVHLQLHHINEHKQTAHRIADLYNNINP